MTKRKKEIDKKTKSNKDLLNALKEALEGKVSDVKLSSRLKDAPVCLVSGEGLSLEMEKVLKQMPNSDEIKAEKILEINPEHELFNTLNHVFEVDKDDIKDYATMLYHQALIMEGLPIEDPTDYVKAMTKLMVKKGN